jgi:hypothetical protein
MKQSKKQFYIDGFTVGKVTGGDSDEERSAVAGSVPGTRAGRRGEH